jgi:demethylmenaquinone methyltransferase/2-methoxy-6-polyprenyl-1,4-benzoquinol methylase
MLEHAERKRKAAGLEGVEFQEADSMALPFEDDYFQAVTCAFGLRNIQDTEQGLREMARVCKPGGQVGILEFSHPTAPVLKQSYQAYFRYVLPRIGQAVASNDQSAYEYLPNSVREFPSGQALADVMQQCGYSNVKLFPMTLGVATLYLGEVN